MKNEKLSFSTNLSSTKIRVHHRSNPSDLSFLRDIHKAEKQKKNSDVRIDKFNCIETEWTKYKTAKNCSTKISFNKPSKISSKKEQSKEALNIATKAFQLLGQKPNKQPDITKKNSQLSLLIKSAYKELARFK